MVGSGGFLDVSKTKLYDTGSDFKIGFGLKLFLNLNIEIGFN